MGYEAISCGPSYSHGEQKKILHKGWIVEGQQDADVLERAWWDLVSEWPILAARLRVNPERKDKPGREKWNFDIPDDKQVKVIEEIDRRKVADSKSRIFAIVDRRSECVQNVYPFTTLDDFLTDRISIHEANDDVDLWASNRPKSIQQLLTEDRPMVCIQVCCFKDATMICIIGPAILFLDMKFEEVALAWVNHIQGGSGGLSDLGGIIDTNIKIPQLTVEPPAPPGWRTLSTKEQERLGERLIFKSISNFLLWRRNKDKKIKKFIYIPKLICDEILQQAMRDIGKEIDITLKDALAAWMIKECYKDKAKDLTPLAIQLGMKSEKVLLSDDLDPLAAIQLRRTGLSMTLPEMSTSRIVSELNLGQLATIIHNEIHQQTTTESLNKLALWRFWSIGKFPYPATVNSKLLIFVLPKDGDISKELPTINFSTTIGSNAKILKGWGFVDFGQITSFITLAGLARIDSNGGIMVHALLNRSQWTEAFAFT